MQTDANLRASALKPVAACVLCAALGGAVTYGVLQSRAPDRLAGSTGIVDTRAPGVHDAPEARNLSPSRLDARRDRAPTEAGRSAVLRELARSAAPAFAEAAALALVDVFDDPFEGVELVSSAVEAARRKGLEADILVRLAESDARTAMDAVLELEGHWHRIDTADRIGAVWARQDAQQALTYAQTSSALPPWLRLRFETRVLEAWARVDPQRTLRYVLTREGRHLFLSDGGRGKRIARDIARRRPDELLATAEPLPPGIVRSVLREAAIVRIVQEDLPSALRHAATETPESDQAQWIGPITRVYAEQDPVGALQWARDLEFAAPGTLEDMVEAVYAAHPGRIDELRLCELSPTVAVACRP